MGDLVKLISRQANAHWLAVVQTIHYRSSTNQPWSPPPPGWHKINVDAAFDNGSAHSGIIIKNENGSIGMAAINHHYCLDAITAKCLSIFEACSLLSTLKLKDAIIESDCLNAISCINSPSLNNF
ncbi:hypothetical protein CASFOL_040474 [Castilleja foliolosa]|uniref:RNase H type-1 domain-containing protein n=1 Tax=Castilleja foliolosa TaxID=1961234 RepID=A0ABD3BBQ6_9LAMI